MATDKRGRMQMSLWLTESVRDALVLFMKRNKICADGKRYNKQSEVIEKAIKSYIGWRNGNMMSFDEIKREFQDAEIIEDEEGRKIKSVYLGFMPWPSGKMYMPWATGNVSEDEIDKDAEWYDNLEAELEKIRAWLESGEGDPCDLYAVMEVE